MSERFDSIFAWSLVALTGSILSCSSGAAAPHDESGGAAGSSTSGAGFGGAAGNSSGMGGTGATGGTSPSGGAAGANAGTAGSSVGTGGVAGSAGTAPSGGAAGGGDAGTGASGGGAADSAGASGTSGAGGSAGSGGTSSVCMDGAAETFFVDAAAGDDANPGTTSESAWRSLEPVNARTFQPGERLCFKAGGTWTGQLAPQGSGSEGTPIVVAQYGTGDKPRIDAGEGDLQALLLSNQSHWEINDLELTNDQGAPGDFRGISVRGRDAGTIRHIVIRNTFIHDVTGHVNWIGGDAADDDPPWVKFKTGWDASKRTGGIVFEIDTVASTPTWFDGVIIENNVIQDTSFGGIVFKQFEGSVGWGVRRSANDSRFKPHKNIVIRNNFVSQSGTDYGCNGMYVTGAQSVLIEGNVVKDAGTSAIEAYNADDVIIQHNETYGTVRKAGGADFNGIDADRATTNTIIQYNYVHDNGDGILLCQFAFGDSIVRYNLVVDNSRYSINLHSDDAATNQTYNNLFFVDGLGSATLIGSSGGSDYFSARYDVRNNVFRTTRSADVAAAGSGVTYSNNLWSGISPPASDAAPRTGDPLFVDATARPNGTGSGPALDMLSGFQLREGSPALNNGAAISDNGGHDFWNTTLYNGAPDIGPYEAP